MKHDALAGASLAITALDLEMFDRHRAPGARLQLLEVPALDVAADAFRGRTFERHLTCGEQDRAVAEGRHPIELVRDDDDRRAALDHAREMVKCLLLKGAV